MCMKKINESHTQAEHKSGCILHYAIPSSFAWWFYLAKKKNKKKLQISQTSYDARALDAPKPEHTHTIPHSTQKTNNKSVDSIYSMQ